MVGGRGAYAGWVNVRLYEPSEYSVDKENTVGVYAGTGTTMSHATDVRTGDVWQPAAATSTV